jgi:hypothetical protein
MSKGIITGACDEYMPTLELFAICCKEQKANLAVFDDGLNGKNISLLKEYDVTILDPLPPIEALKRADLFSKWKVPLKAYEKPFKCQKTIFDQTLWIDADAIPLRHIDKAFEVLERQSIFFTFPFSSPNSCCNLDLLRRLHLTGTYVPINSGVLGWNGQNATIDLWAATTIYVVNNPQLCQLPVKCDQDILCYAINVLGQEKNLLTNLAFNAPANLKVEGQHTDRKSYQIKDPQERLEAIRTDHPEIYIVHWMGGQNKLQAVL